MEVVDDEKAVRVGIAFTPERRGRCDEYNIYQTAPTAYGREVSQELLVRYAGYREGSTWTGLPFAGPGAVYSQPYLPFRRNDFHRVLFFEEYQHLEKETE